MKPLRKHRHCLALRISSRTLIVGGPRIYCERRDLNIGEDNEIGWFSPGMTPIASFDLWRYSITTSGRRVSRDYEHEGINNNAYMWPVLTVPSLPCRIRTKSSSWTRAISQSGARCTAHVRINVVTLKTWHISVALTVAIYSNRTCRGSRYFERVHEDECTEKGNRTSVILGIETNSISGSYS
jgi:hypothetical protein